MLFDSRCILLIATTASTVFLKRRHLINRWMILAQISFRRSFTASWSRVLLIARASWICALRTAETFLINLMSLTFFLAISACTAFLNRHRLTKLTITFLAINYLRRSSIICKLCFFRMTFAFSASWDICLSVSLLFLVPSCLFESLLTCTIQYTSWRNFLRRTKL